MGRAGSLASIHPEVLNTSLSGVTTGRFVFCGDQDFSSFLAWLAEYPKRFGSDTHACVLMTNQVHILATHQGEEET